MRDRLVLDLCGGTGAWSLPYKRAGYEVVVVTLPENDVRRFPIPTVPVHGILAAPPCTEFASSGARWWAAKPPELLAEALDTVDACLTIITECRPKWWAMENPIGRLKRLRYADLGEPRLVFDPCDYGDPYRKRTQLWGRFRRPKMTPVDPIGLSPIHHASPGPRRQEFRSATPPGFAQAFYEANP